MTTWPAPSVPLFQAGYGPQQSDMTTLWTDNLGFFQTRVVFRANQSVNSTTLPDSGAKTTIEFDTVLEDPYSGWDSSTYTWGPPSGYSGWYEVMLRIGTSTPDASNIMLLPYLGTVGSLADLRLADIVLPPDNTGGAEGSWVVYLAGGQDRVSGAAVILGASASLTTDTSQPSTMSITWLLGGG